MTPSDYKRHILRHSESNTKIDLPASCTSVKIVDRNHYTILQRVEAFDQNDLNPSEALWKYYSKDDTICTYSVWVSYNKPSIVSEGWEPGVTSPNIFATKSLTISPNLMILLGNTFNVHHSRRLSCSEMLVDVLMGKSDDVSNGTRPASIKVLREELLNPFLEKWRLVLLEKGSHLYDPGTSYRILRNVIHQRLNSFGILLPIVVSQDHYRARNLKSEDKVIISELYEDPFSEVLSHMHNYVKANYSDYYERWTLYKE